MNFPVPKRFEWTPEFSVNVEEMDEQHRTFIRLTNEVLEFAENCDDSEGAHKQILTMLRKLRDYTFYHLGSEETYFEEFACENMKHHLEAHALFRKTVQEAEEKLNNGIDVCSIGKEIANFCGSWLLNHILTMDKGYTSCFRQHGKA